MKTLSNCVNFGDPKEYYQQLRQINEQYEKDADKQFLQTCFEAFGNGDRFLILDSLRQKDRCVCELEAILHKTQPAVSHHMRILEEAGLIRGWKKGKFTHYSLIRQQFNKMTSIFQRWLLEITNFMDMTKSEI